MKRSTAFYLSVAAVLCGVAAAVPAAGADAREIMREAQRRTEVASERYEGSLQVIDAGGRVTDKRWQYERLGSHGSSRSVLRFTAPAEVKGVALLIVNHPDRASDQWMWTPAIARERRIALQDRSTRFFGTDFSFEDLEERDIEQYEFRLLGEEPIDGVMCWQIEAWPRQTKISQYTKSRIWVRQDTYAYAQVENEVRGVLVRRLKYSSFERVQGIWTARLLEMTDLRRKSKTVLKLDRLEYNVTMKADDFTLQALRRER